jgi:hypothetical protein
MTPTTAEAAAGAVGLVQERPAPVDVEMSKKSDQTPEKSAGDADGEAGDKHAEVKDFTPSHGLTTTGMWVRMQ